MFSQKECLISLFDMSLYFERDSCLICIATLKTDHYNSRSGKRDVQKYLLLSRSTLNVLFKSNKNNIVRTKN